MGIKLLNTRFLDIAWFLFCAGAMDERERREQPSTLPLHDTPMEQREGREQPSTLPPPDATGTSLRIISYLKSVW